MKEKKLTHHEIIDRIEEQTASMTIQVSKESKLRIHPNLRRPRFSSTYSFKFTYKCFVRLAFHNNFEILIINVIKTLKTVSFLSYLCKIIVQALEYNRNIR